MDFPIFKPWPFEKDEKVLLYWISSPWTDSIMTGMRFVRAYFQREDASFKNVVYAWGNLSLLLIGYYYQNGRILERNAELKKFTFKNEWIKEQRIENAKDLIPLKMYSLSSAKIQFDEKCISLVVGKKNYIIPCIEIVRAIYGMTPFFLESLLSTERLFSFAHFTENSDKSLSVDFYSSFPVELFRRDQFLNAFIFLTQNKVIYDWRERVYSQSSLNSKIVAQYPDLQGASLVGYGLPCLYDKILLLNISILGLKQSYEKVEFTHPVYIEPQNPTDKSSIHYVKGEDNTEEDVILSSEEAANKKRKAKIVAATEASLQFPKISHIERRKTSGDKHETKKVFINKTRQEMFSTGPRVGDAEATAVEMELIESKEITILEPGFEAFGKVITKISKFLGTTIFSCHFFTLPDVIPIPDMPDGTKRKYALVKFEYYGKRVCIIEICSIDFAISTLVVCGVDAEREAYKILKSLEGTNGHWNKNIIVMLSNMSKETRIVTLKHFDGRSVDKWTELIMKNIE